MTNENDWDLLRKLVCECGDDGCPRRAVVDRLEASQPRATTEPIWAIAYRGDEDALVDEYYEVRDYAEEEIATIREAIAVGRWSAEEFEPITLMQGTLTKFREVEGGWRRATDVPESER